VRSISFQILIAAVAFLLSAGAAEAKPKAAASQPSPGAYVLHLPGVSGESVVDHTLIDGFRAGHLEAMIEIYDWTEHDGGVPALQAIERNKKQAKKIAEQLTTQFRARPSTPIYLTSHSGGAGLAAWALEDLPADVKVKRVVFIAPALSPGYDLSKALAHVTDRAIVLYSDGDSLILSTGTRVFGTIDGVYSDAAGFSGFKPPADSDAAQYAKLKQISYDPAWIQYGHGGDHIGPMATAFSKAVIVPLLQGKTIATQPAGAVHGR
jgi:hypothetical protein